MADRVRVRLTDGSLAKVGAERVGEHTHLWLRCKKCGQTWSPNLLEGGNLPRGWWHCPNGCNTKAKA